MQVDPRPAAAKQPAAHTCTAKCSTAGPESDGLGVRMPSWEDRGVARTSSVTVPTL